MRTKSELLIIAEIIIDGNWDKYFFVKPTNIRVYEDEKDQTILNAVWENCDGYGLDEELVVRNLSLGNIYEFLYREGVLVINKDYER